MSCKNLKVVASAINTQWWRETRWNASVQEVLETTCEPGLGQLHHISSIIIAITFSKVSIALQLQVLCAKTVKLQLFLNLYLITNTF